MLRVEGRWATRRGYGGDANRQSTRVVPAQTAVECPSVRAGVCPGRLVTQVGGQSNEAHLVGFAQALVGIEGETGWQVSPRRLRGGFLLNDHRRCPLLAPVEQCDHRNQQQCANGLSRIQALAEENRLAEHGYRWRGCNDGGRHRIGHLGHRREGRRGTRQRAVIEEQRQ